MSDPFVPSAASSILVEAWRTGLLVTALPEEVRPRSLSEGYDIQDSMVEALGLPVAGWKLGVGSPVLKRQTGVGRSIAGRILAPHVYGDGATIPLPNAAPVTVEFEIAFILGRDIHPGDEAFPVMDAVQDVRVAFELVLSRFVDRRAVGWPSFAADNGAFQALVLGESVSAEQVEAVAESLVVSQDGKDMARCVTGDDFTNSAGALADLIALARERSMVLPKGSIISTGTLSKPFNVAGPSVEVKARFLDRTLGFKTLVRQGGALLHGSAQDMPGRYMR